MKRTVFLLGVALLLSLGLNALQWMGAPSEETSEGGSEAADSVVVSATNEDPEETGCWVELAECRADAVDESEEVVRVFTHHEAAASGPSTPGEPSGPLTGVAARDVGAELQEEMLCTIATRHLRDAWASQRDQTIEDLKRSLADDEERREMQERDVRRVTGLFEGTDGDRAAFEEAYRGLWDERISDLREAWAEEPADSAAAFAVAKSLFEDEDALTAERYGDEGVRRLRLAQAERRTVVLALLAAHAGLEWDATIGW